MSSTVNLLQPTYNVDTSNSYQSNSSNSRAVNTDSSLLGYTESGTAITNGTVNTSKDIFLKLLVAQMSNMDPFGENQDPTQYITQLAQFSTLEQMQTMNQNLEGLYVVNNGLLINSAVSTASNFLGKDAEFLTSPESSETVTGRVDSVYIENGLVYLEVTLEDGEVKSFPYDSFVKVIA